MPREKKEKPPRVPHRVEPIEGEAGRFRVESATTPGEFYVVDINNDVVSEGVMWHGTCPCKGWSVRKRCTHLDDARAYHCNVNDQTPLELPSGRVYFASNVFLARMNEEDRAFWFDELVKRDNQRERELLVSRSQDDWHGE